MGAGRRFVRRGANERNGEVRKKILFVVDVPGWAWFKKSEAIQRCLRDEFKADVWWPGKCVIPKGFDLYLTFCPPMLEHLRGVERERKVTGTTGYIRFDEWFVGDKAFYEAEVAALHANSLSLLERIKLYHDNVFYVPNGVDTSLFKQQDLTKKDGLVVGFVGSEYSIVYKGLVDYILPATLVAGVKLSTNLCIHLNKFSEQKMVSFYKEIDVYVVASVEEGTPNPMLEAASCGRPVISNRVGNAPEFVINGESGFLVERSMKSYVEALQYFEDTPKEVLRMGLNARKQAEKWDWKIQAENYRKMFRELT